MQAPTILSPALFTGFLLLCGQAFAEVYKWVDRNGVTQYSQTPPPDQRYETVSTDPAPTPDPEVTERLKAARDALNASSEERVKRQAKSRESAEQAKQRRAECDALRDRLTTLMNNPRINTYAQDGLVERMSEEKRQAEIEQLRGLIAKDCGR